MELVHTISPSLAVLHWLPVHFRTSFKEMVLTYNILNGLGYHHLAEDRLPVRTAQVGLIPCILSHFEPMALQGWTTRKDHRAEPAFLVLLKAL